MVSGEGVLTLYDVCPVAKVITVVEILGFWFLGLGFRVLALSSAFSPSQW